MSEAAVIQPFEMDDLVLKTKVSIKTFPNGQAVLFIGDRDYAFNSAGELIGTGVSFMDNSGARTCTTPWCGVFPVLGGKIQPMPVAILAGFDIAEAWVRSSQHDHPELCFGYALIFLKDLSFILRDA